MGIGVIVDFNLKPGGAEKLKALMEERFPQTRMRAGCEYIYLGEDEDDPNHLVLVEKWTSREQYAVFREWAMNQPGTEEIMSYLTDELTTTYLEDMGV